MIHINPFLCILKSTTSCFSFKIFFSGAVNQDRGENDDDDDNDDDGDDDDDGIGNWKWIIPIIVLCVVIILLMIIMYACLRYKTLGNFNGQGLGMNEIAFSVCTLNISTSNDRLFYCPIIYTYTIHYVILFIETSTRLDTTKLIH